ncbi:uncharacterized protein [Dermacentor albipictus]|uniref:uncharacterized protein n=1 Tax=Dermacentor albipictus TaxID=60249 RepID=UPI0038FCFDAB
MANYHPLLLTIISVDSSSFGLGAVLLQAQPSEERRAVAYASLSISPTEQSYSQTEKEGLAVAWAVKRFDEYVHGLYLTVKTDRFPLTSLLGSMDVNALPPRIQTIRLKLMRYQYRILYVPGKLLAMADTLSRAPVTPVSTAEENQVELYASEVVSSIEQDTPIGFEAVGPHQPMNVLVEFASFAKNYGFSHVTSSPGYPQSNDAVERAVHTVKDLFRNSNDYFLALLAYCNTPGVTGYSPSQLLMGQWLRIHAPRDHGKLSPEIPPPDVFSQKDTTAKKRQARNFNCRHGVLSRAQRPRSYIVETPGSVMQRNRRHLVPFTTEQPTLDSGASSPDKPNLPSPTLFPSPGPSQEQASPGKHERSARRDMAGIPEEVTRSGRRVVPPKRLNL